MKKGINQNSITLPLISKHYYSQKNSTKKTRGSGDQEVVEQIESEKNQIEELQKWSTKNYQGFKSKGSNMFSFTRGSNQKLKKRMTIQSAATMDAKLYIIRLQNQLKKAYDINYASVYKNLQYCSGMYENFYGGILKYLQKLLDSLTGRFNQLSNNIAEQRKIHISKLQGADKQNYYQKIPLVRDELDKKQQELDPLKNAIESLQNTKSRVLEHALLNGYDVRQQGLVWILKTLGFVPKDCFPPFLNEKQIHYIISKFERESIKMMQREKDYIIEEDIKKGSLLDDPNNMSVILTRRKKRQLSMVKQQEFFEKLKMMHRQQYSTDRHKYIDPDILKMAEEQFPKTKSTKYEIIYKETVKKLNKYCISQIYRKNTIKKHQHQRDIVQNRRDSLNTLNILSQFDAKIQEYLRTKNTEKPLLNDQEKQLDEIIRSLRYEAYQDHPTNKKNDRSIRNPISIINCLVGWRKAKRIIEQEMSYLL